MTKPPYHEGEIEVQTRAGVVDMAARVGRSIRSEIPRAAADFLRAQPFVAIGAADDAGRVWASILTGRPGFAHAESDRDVWIDALPREGDPLRGAFDEPAPVGLIAIEFATRRRMRVNGIASRIGPSIAVRADQVYSNCPKYIQARTIETGGAVASSVAATRSPRLSERQRAWIEAADTFFVATRFGDGADVSHRGGNPGFVRTEDGAKLVWPDYSGNMMFQTLGNIAADPRAGLIFVDFESGSTLQITGRARIVWDKDRVAEVAGAERLVELSVDEVVEIAGATPLRGRLVERSPYNP